jgi:hypothetical protein
MVASLLLLTLSTACTRSPVSAGPVLARTLPATPAWAKPVAVPRPPDDTDWEIVARAEQNGRKLANGRLTCLADWIDERRVELAGGKGRVLPCEVSK